MYKHKRKNEDILYETPKTRNKIVDDVSNELTNNERFLTDAQGLRLAYENPDGLYQNGSILYIAGTKSAQDFWDDLKLPFHKTQLTKRYKDADKFIQDGAIEAEGKKDYGITDIISHSLGSAVSAELNNNYDNQFRTRSYGAPHWSNQNTEDLGTNLRIRGSGDIVSAFDNAPITVNKGSFNPLYNHSFEDIANVKNKAGNVPITEEEFMEQFN